MRIYRQKVFESEGSVERSSQAIFHPLDMVITLTLLKGGRESGVRTQSLLPYCLQCCCLFIYRRRDLLVGFCLVLPGGRCIKGDFPPLDNKCDFALYLPGFVQWFGSYPSLKPTTFRTISIVFFTVWGANGVLTVFTECDTTYLLQWRQTWAGTVFTSCEPEPYYARDMNKSQVFSYGYLNHHAEPGWYRKCAFIYLIQLN